MPLINKTKRVKKTDNVELLKAQNLFIEERLTNDTKPSLNIKTLVMEGMGFEIN